MPLQVYLSKVVLLLKSVLIKNMKTIKSILIRSHIRFLTIVYLNERKFVCFIHLVIIVVRMIFFNCIDDIGLITFFPDEDGEGRRVDFRQYLSTILDVGEQIISTVSSSTIRHPNGGIEYNFVETTNLGNTVVTQERINVPPLTDHMEHHVGRVTPAPNNHRNDCYFRFNYVNHTSLLWEIKTNPHFESQLHTNHGEVLDISTRFNIGQNGEVLSRWRIHRFHSTDVWPRGYIIRERI